ncbi:MAG: GGDEF domain-containing protein, partial [Nitrospirae bacterium]|nr:GGDEF domain-containing protein [Nitrospirota bacterium]
MSNYADFLLNLLAQFGGGRGETENELVRFGLAATFWGVLFAAAWSRWRQKALRHEKFLIWGFGLGFIREVFMFAVFSLDLLGAVRFDFMHVFFPPLEHVISMAAVIVVASAFLRYIQGDILLSRRFLQIGLGVSAFCYLATAQWWAEAVTANPLLRFGQTWADWLFRISASLLIAFPIIILAKERRWLSDIVVAALSMFFLDEFLMLFNLASGALYREIYGPIRHNLHLLAIPLLGYVY